MMGIALASQVLLCVLTLPQSEKLLPLDKTCFNALGSFCTCPAGTRVEMPKGWVTLSHLCECSANSRYGNTDYSNYDCCTDSSLCRIVAGIAPISTIFFNFLSSYLFTSC